MKRFVVNISVFFLVVFGLLGTLFYGLTFVQTPALRFLYGPELMKRDLLKNTLGSRIILVGGSNLEYGIDSEMIEKSFGMPVVNAGFHAGFGICYQMDTALRYLHKGDIVVVSPEYSNFSANNQHLGEMVLMQLVLDILPKEDRHLTIRQWLHQVSNMPEYMFWKIYRLVFPRNCSDHDSWRKDYNQYGDLIKHRGKDSIIRPIPLRADTNPVRLNTDAVRYIQLFKQEVELRGASVYFTPPALERNSYLNSKSYMLAVERQMAANGCAFMSPTERYVFDISDIYNTVYHLTWNARGRRTRLLIEDLQHNIEKGNR